MSTGILTCLPSTTPLGLALGPDSPPTDEPCRGTLRFSGHWILTNVFVTQADILASALSTETHVKASPIAERSPTDLFRIAACDSFQKTNLNKCIFLTSISSRSSSQPSTTKLCRVAIKDCDQLRWPSYLLRRGCNQRLLPVLIFVIFVIFVIFERSLLALIVPVGFDQK